jgi:hypothetical protein
MVRMVPMAEAAPADCLAISMAGSEIAHKTPMIATTNRRSIRAKPSVFRIMVVASLVGLDSRCRAG